MRKNSIKNTRINGEVQKELSMIIHGGLKDPRIHPMTSVTAVSVAPDLKTCKAYISVLGDEQAQKDTIAGLRSAEGYIRRELARTVNLRNTPQITFIADQSIEYGIQMSKLIDEVTKADSASWTEEASEDADDADCEEDVRDDEDDEDWDDEDDDDGENGDTPDGAGEETRA